MLRDTLKSVLKSSAPYKRVHDYFRRATIDRYEFVRGFMVENAWLFSQPKSGTNLVCSTVAFYNAERIGLEGYSFGDRYRLGVLHSSRVNAETIENFNRFRLQSRVPVFIRTHDDIPGAKPRFVVNVTRNVLDNLVSVYHFTWQPRGVNVDDAIEPMVSDFAAIHMAQRNAAARNENSIFVRYESLKSNPVESFTSVFNLVFGETDQAALTAALAAGTPERFKEWERENGAFVPTATKKLQKSFIRSGKVGEGSEFFSNAQRERIASVLERTRLIDDPDVVL